MSLIEKLRDLPNEAKQFFFVMGVLLGGLNLVLLLFWLVGGDSGAGGALLFINGTIAVCGGLIWLATKLFPSNR